MIADRHLCPLSGEPARDHGPDAGRAAGYQDGFAGEVGDDEARSGHEGGFRRGGGDSRMTAGEGRVNEAGPPRYGMFRLPVYILCGQEEAG